MKLFEEVKLLKKYKELDRLILKYLLIIALIIFMVIKHEDIGEFLSSFFSIVSPLFYGAGLAFIINNIVEFYEKWYFPNTEKVWVKKSRRPICITLSLLTIIIVLVVVISLVVPQLFGVVVTFVEAIPDLVHLMQQWVEQNEEIFPQLDVLLENVDINWQAIIQNAVSFINNVSSNLLVVTISTTASILIATYNIVIAIIIAFYIMMSKEQLFEKSNRFAAAYLSNKVKNMVFYVIRIFDESFSNFITGTVIEASILGTIIGVGMWILNLPYAMMIGVLTGVTSVIPILGAYISASVGFFLILVESPMQALIFILYVVVAQQFESNVIYPKVVGNKIGLPGLWVIVAVTIGGGIWGILGMVIGVPLASALYKILQDHLAYVETSKEIESNNKS